MVGEYGPRLHVPHWRGHQTSNSGEFKRQTASVLNCNLNPLFLAKLFRYTVCFVMVLYRNRNQDLTEIEYRRILLSCDGFRKTDLGIDFIADAF